MKWLPSLLIFLSACLPLPKDSAPTSSSLYLASGDIIAASTTTDSIYQFGEDGTFKRVLWTAPLATETIGGLSWDSLNNELLVSVDGTPDRVMAISAVDGSVRLAIQDTNITGTVRGLARLIDSGDYIVTEGTTNERTLGDGTRITYAGAWPSNVHTNIQHIVPLPDGTYLTCSSGGAARIYPDSTTAGFVHDFTVSSPAGTTASYGCDVFPDGRIVVSWEGAAADYVSLYDSSLTFDSHIFGNAQGVLGAPRGVAVHRNGNVLVADNVRDRILEVDMDGKVVKNIGVGVLDSPVPVIVVPNLSP